MKLKLLHLNQIWTHGHWLLLKQILIDTALIHPKMAERQDRKIFYNSKLPIAFWASKHVTLAGDPFFVFGKVLESSGVPRFYIKLLVQLDDYANATLANKEAKKKMSPTNAKVRRLEVIQKHFKNVSTTLHRIGK